MILQKIFGKDDDATEKIEQHIQAPNPDIDPFSVEYDDGEVTLAGEASSRVAYEKPFSWRGTSKVLQ